MAKKYLDYDGLLYFWQKIKTLFSSKAEGVKTITRSGTTFTVTRADDTTFTFTQQDNTVSKTTTTPKVNGTAAVGSETKYAAGDHVHPTDTSRAPNAHASTETTYGVGTSSNYGHVKLSDSTSSTTSTSGGTAATPKAVKDALDAAKAYVNGDTLIYDKVNTDGTVHVCNYDDDRDFNFLEGTTLQAKIDGIAAGAEVNQNAFSNVKVGNTTVAAATKTDTFELAAGSNVTLTAPNNTITIAATDTTYESKAAASGGTAVSLVTTGEKYTWNSKASLASPIFTGTPKAPTAAAGTNTTQIATTEFVQSAVSTAVTGAVAYQGIAPTSFAPTNYKAGWYWIIGTAGTYVGQVCEAGDMIFCKTAAATYSAANFDVVQTNLDITSITNAEIDTILAA